MRIRNIKVVNFRNLKNVELSPATTTVLVGENNSGKSNLLYALRLLLDPDAINLRAELSLDDINDSARLEGIDYFTISIEIGDLQKHQELEAVFMDCIATDGAETYVTIEGTYGPDEDKEYGWKMRVLRPAGRQGEPLVFIRRMARQIPLFFLAAVRDAEREMRATGRASLSQLLEDISFADVQEEIVANIRKANEALGKNADITELSQNIENLIAPQVPGSQAEVSIKVASEDTTTLTKGLRLNLKRPADCKEYDMSRHGTGLQNLVLIAMFRHKIAKARTVQPILAIEEPEAHLHPQAQRCLYKDIEGINSPVIITTHSTSLVECCSPLGLVKFMSDQNNQTRAHQIDATKLDPEDIPLLKRMMRAGRAAAFFARAIIIVEGLSEEIALPAFARHMGYNLDRDGISVINADGNAFAYILKACNEDNFAVPCVVTFDTDALEDGNTLVAQAYKARLIDQSTCHDYKDTTAKERQKLLSGLGWIPAQSNFEEECGNSGFLGIIRKAIDEEGATKRMEGYMTEKSLTNDLHGIAAFLKNSRRGESLKIPIAYKIANEVGSIGHVPSCYAEAINLARKFAKVAK